MDRRYQQSTHDKQQRDRYKILKWIKEGDEKRPEWLSEVLVPNLRNRAPDSAIGKLILCLLNRQSLKDPISAKPVGYRQGAQTTARHHIFPTKFVKQLSDWGKEDDNNLALNIMLISEPTNSSWFNMDPAAQFQLAAKTSSEREVRNIYDDHLIPDSALSILRKPQKSRDDFLDFVAERERAVLEILKDLGFRPVPASVSGDPDEIEDD